MFVAESITIAKNQELKNSENTLVERKHCYITSPYLYELANDFQDGVAKEQHIHTDRT
jgi:hypothetical protein